jgi:soluble cytochrome b562
MSVKTDDTSLNSMSEALGEVEETQEVEEATKEVEQETQVEKLKVGDQEFTQEELSELVGLGSKAKEVGEHHGGFDKFVSEFGKKSQRIGELQEKLDEFNTAKQTGDAEGVEDSLEQARDAARKLGIVLKDDLDSYYENRRQGERLLESCQSLEETIDGSDGRPKFEAKEVLEFMAENPGFKDPNKAYEALHMDEMTSWRVAKLQKEKKGIVTQEETSLSKQPKTVTPNRENLHSLIGEIMSQE